MTRRLDLSGLSDSDLCEERARSAALARRRPRWTAAPTRLDAAPMPAVVASGDASAALTFFLQDGGLSGCAVTFDASGGGSGGGGCGGGEG